MYPRIEPHEVDNPTVYIEGSDIINGRVVAADFAGGSFDLITPELTNYEVNSFTLGSLGFSVSAIADLCSTSHAAIRNRLHNTRLKLGNDNTSMPISIATCVRTDKLRITRPSYPLDLPDGQLNKVWYLIDRGLSKYDLSRQLGRSIRMTEAYSQRLYDRLGVSNKAAASLLKYMSIYDTNTTSYINGKSVTGEDQITSILFKGGMLDISPESRLNDIENDALMLRATGHDVEETSYKMFGDSRDSHYRLTVSATQEATSKYEAYDVPNAIRNMCIAGHLTLQRECTPLKPDRTPTEEYIWEQCARGLTYSDIAQRTDNSYSAVQTSAWRLYEKINVNNRTQAVVRWFMSHPTAAMLPPENTYAIRQQGGIVLPNPRSLRK